MTIDVNVLNADEDFLDDIDEVIEDTMVQIFLLRSTNQTELQNVKEKAACHNSLFYYAPISLIESIDSKCKALLVQNTQELEIACDMPIYIDAQLLDEESIATLKKSKRRGIILNATKTYEELENFCICLTNHNIEMFEENQIAELPMQRIVLSSQYPKSTFAEIFTLSKKISDKNFRPDPSIIATATKNSLALFKLIECSE